jgi:competence protein ComEC
MQMIRDIKAIPVLRPLIALVFGIVIGKSIGGSMIYLFAFMFLSLITFLFILFFRIALKPRHSSLIGILIFGWFVTCGMLINKVFYFNHKVIPGNPNEYWMGEVLSSPVIKNKLVRFDMKLFDDSVPQVKYNTQVMMQIGPGVLLPQPGQIICFKTTPERIQGPANPGEFNFAAYMESRGFLYRCFIREGEWSYISTHNQWSLRLLTLKLRVILWNKIESLEPQNKNLGVLYALVLGSKELLTPEIREAYAATGAMHVLAVSGLHVGMIWMVLGFIFIWLKELPGGKYLQFFVIAGLIWFYAIMTGATPSVVRSAGMFSLVSLGKIIQKETSVYNSLSVSAFFGLLINPQWLTDAGFQLSYTAVLSIVFFQPRISTLFTPSNWLMKKIWDISSVSIAAQIGTLPLTFFYFNRFPPWFIVSNLIVIPLVTVVMILFIVMLLFIMLPAVFSLILKILLFIIGLMNTSLSFIEGLPGPALDRIYLSDFQLFCFVLMLLGIIWFIKYRNNFFLVSGLVSLLLFTTEGTIRKQFSGRQAELVLFSAPGKMIMGIIEGKSGMFFHNFPDSVDISQSFNYTCKPFIVKRGIAKVEVKGLKDSMSLPTGFQTIPGKFNYFFRSGNITVIVLNDASFFRGMRSFNTLKSDILILNSRMPDVLRGQDPLFKTNLLVVSTAVSRYLQFESGERTVIQCDSIIDTRFSGFLSCPLYLAE